MEEIGHPRPAHEPVLTYSVHQVICQVRWGYQRLLAPHAHDIVQGTQLRAIGLDPQLPPHVALKPVERHGCDLGLGGVYVSPPGSYPLQVL